METLRMVLEEEQAVCLVALGLLSLVMAYSFGHFAPLHKLQKSVSHNFWIYQVIMVSSGLMIVMWPYLGFEVTLLTVLVCSLLVYSMARLSSNCRIA